ncbi:DUF1905 domain-containing protein [uncultured Dysosmobacter sp.]|uniref:DUF1905 domain-containing protein n=1 Tax=uncultured Dysosmobacter sp. TaxID=2591384 RepID=UPI00262944EA|nr:DUF1905 domain-containing protein [uncultured Dysosmobacter sp.]
MLLEFESCIRQEGNRCFAPIPFNVWEKVGQKGNIPCRVTIGDTTFECKLLPKGKGLYWVPVPKSIAGSFPPEAVVSVAVEPIPTLSRINRDSPYSRENPIRKIDSITSIPIRRGCCGHSCVAMLAGVPLDDVIALMGKAEASWSKITEALDYYGIAYADRPVYPRGKPCILPRCAIVNNDNTFLLWYRGAYYGMDATDERKTVSYLEILTA